MYAPTARHGWHRKPLYPPQVSTRLSALVFKVWTTAIHLKALVLAERFLHHPLHRGRHPPLAAHTRSCHAWSAGRRGFLADGAYQEIVPDERISFTHAWENEDGSKQHETLVTITLADTDERAARG